MPAEQVISTTQSLRFHPANIWGAGTAAMQTQHLLGLSWHSGSQDLPDSVLTVPNSLATLLGLPRRRLASLELQKKILYTGPACP